MQDGNSSANDAGTRFPPLVEPGPELTVEERQRYARHLILRDFGPVAQRRVRAATALVVGAGGLGSPVLLYLAAAGIGRLVVVDDDTVDLSNLHRQVIHGEGSIGMDKSESASRRLADLAALVEVEAHTVRLDPSNISEFVDDCDLVIDGSDNFATRYLVADACEISGTPLVWGTLDRYRAQFSVFWSAPPASYEPIGLRDVYPEAPAPGTVPSCGEAGILGALTGQIGSLLALQALWLITGVGEPALGRLVLVDSLATTQRSLRLHADPDRARVTALGAISQDVSCELPAGGEAAAGASDEFAQVEEISAAEASRLLGPDSGTVFLDVREAGERAVASIEPSLWVPLGEIADALADPTSPLSRALGGSGGEGSAGGSDDDTAASGTDLVVFCKAGGRSAQAARIIVERAATTGAGGGAVRVRSMAGGIDEWSTEIDPSLPRY
ncbi:ThiF family adenylyltransferase [Dietzia sp.]|uniref:ThiF family adenylyltransferase n=1 Tax=Dietzia sp. TaxID=1871616 RepID=UPI002FDB1AF2